MKPARSPRFQSPALRASSAAISAWGWPRGTGGAAHAVSAAATIHDAARTASLFDPGPMERVNGRCYDAERLVAAYRALKPYTIQAMVTRGSDWDGSSHASVA